jgi:hypothetical protein
MMARGLAVVAAAFCLALSIPTYTVAENPRSDEYAWLSGTFGAVVGTDPESPATAAPDGRPLATWMRRETLEFVVEPPLEDGDSVAFTATAEDGDTIELPLAEERWVTAPDAAGQHTVVAVIERSGSEPARYAWLLDVGDRPGSWETRLTMPALEASLVAKSGSVVGDRGHGCLTGFCQEAGYRPPADSLAPLAVAVGEPLALELSDGSAIVHWQGRAEPHGDTRGETRLAEATFDEPMAGPVLTGLEPDAAGEWLLEVRADYDRERGWQWYLFRLVAE